MNYYYKLRYSFGTIKKMCLEVWETFRFKLKLGNLYFLEFSKQKYVSKIISIDTRDIPEKETLHGFETFVEISLFEALPNVDFSILKRPVGKLLYNNKIKDLEYDDKYAKSMQKSLMELNNELLTKKTEELSTYIETISEEPDKQPELDSLNQVAKFLENQSIELNKKINTQHKTIESNLNELTKITEEINYFAKDLIIKRSEVVSVNKSIKGYKKELNDVSESFNQNMEKLNKISSEYMELKGVTDSIKTLEKELPTNELIDQDLTLENSRIINLTLLLLLSLIVVLSAFVVKLLKENKILKSNK